VAEKEEHRNQTEWNAQSILIFQCNPLYNYPVQGTAADVFKMALFDLKNLFLSDFYMSNFIGRI
jgi:DNA polymerase I-like protein with 3'-5' exonuclease and polymerase domains